MTKAVLVELTGECSKPGAIARSGIYENIGIRYLASYAESKGIPSIVIEQRDKPEDRVQEEVESHNPDFVGFTVMAYNYEQSRQMALRLKRKKDITAIFGGPHASGYPKIVLDEGVDYAVVGEGEETFVELVNVLRQGGKTEEVRGIATKKTLTPRRERIANLDSLPFPKREGIEGNKIIVAGYPAPRDVKSPAVMIYSRGCFGNCSFCQSPQMWGREVYWRSPKGVVEEMRDLQRKYGTNFIGFFDINFNANRKKTHELCNELKKADLGIGWLAECRVSDMDEDLLIAMHEAGCSRVQYGLEAVTNSRLREVHKGLTIGQQKSVLELTDKQGIITRGYLMVGWPNETEEDYKELAQALGNLPIDSIRVSFTTPFIGTRIHEQYKREGLISVHDLSRYTSEYPILKAQISPERQIELRNQVIKEHYESSEYRQRIAQKIKRFPELKDGFEDYFNFLRTKNINVNL